MGGKYKALILWKLMNRTLRFSELRKQVPKATPKMLTQQLRELEQDGLVLRQVYAIVPPKVEYSLTTKGKSLEPVLQALCSWGKTCLNNAAESSD
ncbi:helix-turn-helix domain-containing protein [uncultured Parasutterella sp.]|uniref:winged helix-turn-helix transcriptional regulator n=1 Tax=uncultured Parasutterella sp. TaxID=1263098 RepID=UPI00272C3749|nr:winged helix-turn-helix transcriptional regulator [uncultured Parasutterella sp.]